MGWLRKRRINWLLQRIAGERAEMEALKSSPVTRYLSVAQEIARKAGQIAEMEELVRQLREADEAIKVVTT